MLPDSVLALPEREKTAGAWRDHVNARDADMMQAPSVGAFVQGLLPVQLTEGQQVTYGVWLAIHPAQLPELFDVWHKPEYADLQVDGWLANAIQPCACSARRCVLSSAILATPPTATAPPTQHSMGCCTRSGPTSRSCPRATKAE
jgi:hypothetical protein